MRTSNPVLKETTFQGFDAVEAVRERMTIQGAVLKTAVLLLLLVPAAGFTWFRFATGGPQAAVPWIIGGLVGGLIVALVTVFKSRWAPVTAPIYAILEGLLLGGLSALFEHQYPGIVVMAVGLTFGTLTSMLLLYASRVIRVTDNLRIGIVAATGGIFLVYLASWLLRLFGLSFPFIHDSGMIGIGFSLFVVVLAAFNLVLDFDLIERGAEGGAPKFMEWYAAFALLVTLVWLYLEILRLLAKLKRR